MFITAVLDVHHEWHEHVAVCTRGPYVAPSAPSSCLPGALPAGRDIAMSTLHEWVLAWPYRQLDGGNSMAAAWVGLVVKVLAPMLPSCDMLHFIPSHPTVRPSIAVAPACSASLPRLQDLQLASTSLLPFHGKQLLHALLAGAAGNLQRLDMRDGPLGEGLEALAGATKLTYLDLSGAPMSATACQTRSRSPLQSSTRAARPLQHAALSSEHDPAPTQAPR